jgi:hypothetical protein
MTTKQQDDPFSSTALMPSTHQFPAGLAPSQQSRQLQKAERWIEGEAHKQQLIIHEQQHKTEAAHRAIGSLHASGFEAFTETADHIWEARAPNGRDPVLQREIDHVAARTIQSAAGSIHAATLGSSQLILAEINHSLHRETKEPTLLERIRGRD